MVYSSILIFASALTGQVVICWDDHSSAYCTHGLHLETLGM